MPAIQSKADRDKVRQKSASNRAVVDRIKGVIREYATGATPAACMLKVIRIVKGDRP